MNRRGLVVGLVGDLGLPAAGYYAGHALGLDTVPALAVGGLLALLRIGFVAIRGRRFDGLAALVAGSFLLLLGITLLTGDARVLLAREPIMIAVLGIVLLGSCLLGRPFVYTLALRAVADDPAKRQAMADRWRAEPLTRKHFTVLSAVFGAVLTVESAIGLALVFLLPADVVVSATTAVHLGAIALVVCWALWYRNRRTRARQAAGRPAQHTPGRS
jgi:hypothetical protein